jgi:hypothetical protein
MALAVGSVCEAGSATVVSTALAAEQWLVPAPYVSEHQALLLASYAIGHAAPGSIVQPFATKDLHWGHAHHVLGNADKV